MHNDFVVSDNLLGNTTLHNRSEGVTNRRSDQKNMMMLMLMTNNMMTQVAEVTVKCVN